MPYTVPDIPYAYDALEPHIDEATMHLHHDTHHHAYVDNPLRWSDPLGLEGDEPVRIYDDSEYTKHGSASSSSAKAIFEKRANITSFK